MNINPYENKFIVNFHHADFDGAISGSCVSAAFGEHVVCKAYSIAKVGQATLDIINDCDIVLLTDIGVYDEYRTKLVPYLEKNKLIIYDHHTNENSEKVFSKLGKNTSSVLDPDICGATITWLELSKFYPNNQKLKDLEQIVYLSDVYDMWRLDNPDFEYASKINDLMDWDWNIGYTPDVFRERFLKNPDPYDLSSEEKEWIERKKIRHEKNLKKMASNASLFDFKNHVFVMVESEATDYTKMHFMNEVLETELIDMFIFKYPGGTQSSVRIPTISRIDDLNEWYNDFGCQGHKKAGGIASNEYHRLKKVLDQI